MSTNLERDRKSLIRCIFEGDYSSLAGGHIAASVGDEIHLAFRYPVTPQAGLAEIIATPAGSSVESAGTLSVETMVGTHGRPLSGAGELVVVLNAIAPGSTPVSVTTLGFDGQARDALGLVVDVS